jgi:hypothetical protein
MFDYRETGRRAAQWSCFYLRRKPDFFNRPSTPRHSACYLHRSTLLQPGSAIWELHDYNEPACSVLGAKT